jgi:hypothetical protein
MSNEIEVIVKLIVGTCSMIGLWKILTDVSRVKKSDLREDYSFSHQFFKEYENNKNMQPILVEKGLRAATGTSMLSVNEILYLLASKGPSRSIKIYERCHDYLVFDEKQKKIFFKKRYQSTIYRKIMKILSFIIYFIFSCTILFSLLFMTSFPKFGNTFTILFLAGFFVYCAWSFVNRYAKISVSEEFMNDLSAAEKEGNDH